MAKKGRSPSYPGISLERAIELAGILYSRERTHPAPIGTILSHWSYKPKSSGGWSALAALKKFGLLDDAGKGVDRTAHLTQSAVDIITDPRPDSPGRDELIKEAALAPGIHKVAWDKYGGDLPSPANFKWWLMKGQRFTETGADDFIRHFLATVEYANLHSSGAESESEVDENGRDFSIGDYVQWEQKGVLQLPEACRIVKFYDPEHEVAVLENSSTGVPVRELIAEEPPTGRQPPPPPLPFAASPGSGTQMKQATLPLDEGIMMFQWSSPLSKSSKKLAGVWIDSIVKALIEATDDQQSSEPVAQQESDD